MINAVGFQKMIATGVRMQIKICLRRLALFLSGPSSLYGGIFILVFWYFAFLTGRILQEYQNAANNERYSYGILQCKVVFNNFKMLSF